MSFVRTLLGSDSVPVRRFAVAWAGIAGFVLSSTGLLVFGRDQLDLLLYGLIPGAACAVAIQRATRRRRARTSGSIVGASILAVVASPVIAVIATLLLGGIHHVSAEIVFFLFVGAGIASVFAAPIGVGFGGLFAAMWRQLEAARSYGRSAVEQLWLRFGGASLALGVVVALVAALVPRGVSAQNDLLVPLAVGTIVFGLVTAARGVLLHMSRRDIADRARRGEVRGWAVLPLERVADAAELPELFGPGSSEVLVRRAPGSSGPFRSTETMLPVARL
ncbi:MAG: hypothetical protein R3B82_19105 [Sandaracinaceae bacterium]